MTTQHCTCRVCGGAFEYERRPASPGRLRRFCSDACKAAGSRRQLAEVACETCGKVFYPRYAGTNICSLSCRRYPARRVWANDREAKKANEHARRARLRSALVERFSLAEIFERDGYRCGICGKMTDRSAGARRDRRPSLDHIVPLARGGLHQRTNVQCAHWICNSRKTYVGGGQTKLDLRCGAV